MSEVWVVFTAMKTEIKSQSSCIQHAVTDSALLMLKALFPDTTIGNALKLLEHQSILRIESPSDYFYKVEGSHGEEYHVLRELNYCPCPAYRQILVRNHQLMVRFSQCKHLLAIHLGETMQQIKVLRVEQGDYATLYFASRRTAS